VCHAVRQALETADTLNKCIIQDKSDQAISSTGIDNHTHK